MFFIQTYALFQIQELQHDIEHHSAGVASVLNLCEVLLHDSDACPTEVEFNALQNTMKTLDRRWRNICQLSPERRSRCVDILYGKYNLLICYIYFIKKICLKSFL